MVQASDASLLETFPNPHQGRDYEIVMDCPEFTCLCPLTGQPDFARMHLEYVPDEVCIELKSFKIYLWSFRNVGDFHEKVTNDICDDLVALLRPRRLVLTAQFNVRGGITTKVICRHGD